MKGRVAVVLGGTGFLGSHVCAALRADGYDVLSLARRQVVPLADVRSLSINLAEADSASLGRILATERPDLIVNAGGAVWSGGPSQMSALNAEMVERVLRAVSCLAHTPRFVQLGTAHEYGAAPPNGALTESSVPHPTTPYGRTKLLGAQAILAATKAGIVDGVVLRVTNAIGARVPTASLPGRVRQQLAEARYRGDRAVLRLSPLRAQRDFVNVRDVADAVLCVAHRPVTGEIINVGCGSAVPVRTVVDTLVEISGLDTEIIESGEEITTRSKRIDWQKVDIGRARRLLGWEPRRSLRDSLVDVWQAEDLTGATSRMG